MSWDGLPILIFGSGGVSKDTYYIIKQINECNNCKIYNVLGFVESDSFRIGNEIVDGYKVVVCDECIYEYSKEFPILGVVIPIGNPRIKSKIYNDIKKIENIVYPNIIHPKVIFNSSSIKLGIGNILTSGINLTYDIEVGNFNLINVNSTIGHDTKIGNFNVINPLAAISGNVTIHNNCLIGTGAKVLQQLTIKSNAIVGSGAVVIKNVEENTTVVGIPAKQIK